MYAADRVREMAESGICEPSRLLHILRMMSAGRPLYNSDAEYLDRVAARLASKEEALRRENRRISRVLGSALGGSGAAAPAEPRGAGEAAHAAADPPPPPVVEAGPARPSASPSASPSARPTAPRLAPAPRRPASARPEAPAPTPASPHLATRRPPAPRTEREPPRAPGGASPAPAPAPPGGRTLVDGDLLDAILESREQKRRTSAREMTAEAAEAAGAAAAVTAPAPAPAAGRPPSRPA